MFYFIVCVIANKIMMVCDRNGKLINRPTLSNWTQSPFHFWSFRNVREILPTSPIRADSTKPRPLHGMTNNNSNFLQLKIPNRKLPNETQSLISLLKANETDAIIVVKNG